MFMDIFDLLRKTSDLKASDLHIAAGIPPACRINGRLVHIDNTPLQPEDIESYVKAIVTLEQLSELVNTGELDMSLSVNGHYRFRINIFRQRGCYSMAFRLLNTDILDFAHLGLPPVVEELSKKTRGLILVTGPTGTGKSTTLAAMIDWINRNRDCHIITLEEPIEYLHKHQKSIVNQREIGSDSLSYANALRAVLRQDPDVILIGEMRDLETISIALTAAETGHLVLSTLHTVGASKTIDRIIDVFPPHQQQQVRVQLSMVLQGVISQLLLPTADNSGRVVAVEVMLGNPAIRNLIREGKTHQIASVLQTATRSGMKTMDSSLFELYKRGYISIEDALMYSVDQDYFRKLMAN